MEDRIDEAYLAQWEEMLKSQTAPKHGNDEAGCSSEQKAKIGDFLRQGNILNALNYICPFLFSNEYSSVFKNWYKVKKRVLIKVKLIYFFK